MSEPLPALLLACHFPPEHVIGAHRPGRFFRYLPENGFAPRVVTASPQSQPDERITVEPYHCGIRERILRRTLLLHDDRYMWAGPAERAAAAVLQRHPCRVILSTSPPFSVHLAARNLQRRFGIPWVADIRDPLVGNAARTRPATRWIDAQVEAMLQDADLLILNTDAAQADWQRRHPRSAAKCRTLYNGFDPADVPVPAPPLAARQRRILLHAGSLYMHHYVLLLLDALRLLFERSRLSADAFQLQFIGEVPETIPALPDYAYLAAHGAIDNANAHLPRAEARQRMANADFLLLVDFYRPEGSLQLPAKIFDYLPVGRPILAITTPDSPMHRVLGLSGIPHQVLFPSETVAERAAKIEHLLTLPAGPHALSARYNAEFDGRAQTAQLAGWIRNLLQQGAP